MSTVVEPVQSDPIPAPAGMGIRRHHAPTEIFGLPSARFLLGEKEVSKGCAKGFYFAPTLIFGLPRFLRQLAVYS
jgi:hypothetical protein